MKKCLCFLLVLLLIPTFSACEFKLGNGTEVDSAAFAYKIVVAAEGGSIIVRTDDETGTDDPLDLENLTYKFPNLQPCTHKPFSTAEDCLDPTLWVIGRDTLDEAVADGLLLILDLYVRLDAPEGEVKEADLAVESIDFPADNFLQFILIAGDRFEETTMENYGVFGHVPLSDEPLCRVGSAEETKITVVIFAEGNNPNCDDAHFTYLVNNTDAMTVNLCLTEKDITE